jgi:hypothetical protein
MQSSLSPSVLALLCAVLAVLAATALAQSTCNVYVDVGNPCNTTAQCKNYLTCLSGICVEPYYGANCTGNITACGDPATSPLYCAPDNSCQVRYLDIDDICSRNEQCLTGLCVNTTCQEYPGAAIGAPCNLGQYVPATCPRNYFCLPAGAGLYTCQPPLNDTVSCDLALQVWLNNSNAGLMPNLICRPGSSCISGVCTPLFVGMNGTACAPTANNTAWGPASPDVTCNYGLQCLANASAAGALQCQTQNPLPVLRANCSLTMPCAWGSQCGCSVPQPAGPTSCDPYVIATCSDQLSTLMSCIRQKKCSNRWTTLPRPENVFAGISWPGECFQRQCGREHADFLCCQNNQTNLLSSDLPATPMRWPGDYCKFPPPLPNWIIPSAVLLGIVAVTILIVLLYVLIRRKPDSDYESINK